MATSTRQAAEAYLVFTDARSIEAVEKPDSSFPQQMIQNNWEIIAKNLSKAGWSFGWVSAVDSEGRTILIPDPYRGDGRRFIVRAD